jgi:hypothetical protein
MRHPSRSGGVSPSAFGVFGGWKPPLLLLWVSVAALAASPAAGGTGGLPTRAVEAPSCFPADYVGWAFLPGRYSHDPQSGARVAQYAPKPAVAALPDSRPYASGYMRSRVNQLGPNGTVTTYYRTENWSNRPGPIDAEWERFNDVWQRSVLSGGYYYPAPSGY